MSQRAAGFRLSVQGSARPPTLIPQLGLYVKPFLLISPADVKGKAVSFLGLSGSFHHALVGMNWEPQIEELSSGH